MIPKRIIPYERSNYLNFNDLYGSNNQNVLWLSEGLWKEWFLFNHIKIYQNSITMHYSSRYLTYVPGHHRSVDQEHYSPPENKESGKTIFQMPPLQRYFYKCGKEKDHWQDTIKNHLFDLNISRPSFNKAFHRFHSPKWVSIWYSYCYGSKTIRDIATDNPQILSHMADQWCYFFFCFENIEQDTWDQLYSKYYWRSDLLHINIHFRHHFTLRVKTIETRNAADYYDRIRSHCHWNVVYA